MIPVQGTSFLMGATSEQYGDAWGNESPAHRVVLSSYYLAETVVTQALWQAVMGDDNGVPDLPKTGKSWQECQTFIARLSALVGRRFRLPTEAEWECAARGGFQSKGYKYAGSNDLGQVAWYDLNSGSQIHPVKQKQPNELGFYDMSGNVWEWCSDWYDEYPSDEEDDAEVLRDPQGPSEGRQRVMRGASSSSYNRICRVSSRMGLEPIGKNYASTGFRLALDEQEALRMATPQSDISPNEEPLQQGDNENLASAGNELPKGNMSGGDTRGNTRTKSNVSGTGQYWGTNGGGGHKKKVWPWIIAAAVALLVILIAVSSGKEDEHNEELPPLVEETELMPIEDSYVCGNVTYRDLDKYITGYITEFEREKQNSLKYYLSDYSDGLGFIGATMVAIDDYEAWIEWDSVRSYEEQKPYLDRIDSLRKAFIDHVDILLNKQEQNAKSSDPQVKEDAQNAIKQLKEWKEHIE